MIGSSAVLTWQAAQARKQLRQGAVAGRGRGRVSIAAGNPNLTEILGLGAWVWDRDARQASTESTGGRAPVQGIRTRLARGIVLKFD